jgi:catechol 2,3-dioxygenase-like lactoylglutathione lyase family enzyme
MRLRIVSVPVADQERAKQFYVEQLGFTVMHDDPTEPGRQWVELSPGDGAATVARVPWFPTMAPGTRQGVVLETDEIDATYRTFAARGVVVAGPVQDAPWGHFATFADLDGPGGGLTQSAEVT